MPSLYVISQPHIELQEFIPQFTAAWEKHKFTHFQLRLKGQDMYKPAMVLKELCAERSIKFIVNDSPMLAAEIGADGVHVGADDATVWLARELLGPDKIIGASCYNSIELAQKAEADGASYVSFGAFYPTTTKIAPAQAEVATLKHWKAISHLPCSAIGGINFENKKPLEDAGADYICMVSAIWG